MYTVKKYTKGISIIDEETMDSKFITTEETEIILKELPTLKEPDVAALHIDHLPNAIITVFQGHT